MKALLAGRGFLGSAAPRKADLTLVLEIGMGLALVVGAVLARRRRYRAHALCQTAVVLLNLFVIAGYMMPSFHRQIGAVFPSPVTSHELLAAVHGILGVIAELAALYVMLAAGTNLLPDWLSIAEYKPWMRAVFVLWWSVLLLGIATYLRWYVAPL